MKNLLTLYYNLFSIVRNMVTYIGSGVFILKYAKLIFFFKSVCTQL